MSTTSSISTRYNSLKLEATSHIEVEELVCMWAINVCKADIEKLDGVESPVFTGSGNSPLGLNSWKMKLWKSNEIDRSVSPVQNKPYYSLKLALVSVGDDTNEDELNAYVSTNANSSDEKSQLELEKEISEVTFTRIYVGSRNQKDLLKIYFTEFENEENDYYRNNVFTITCNILARPSEEIEPKNYSLDSGLKYTCSYKKDCVIRTMKSMRNFSDFSDIQLVTPTKTFPVHKIVLAAASPVFAAMFRSSMLESKDNSVDIRDFDEATVEGMLEHMYTEQVSNFEDKAIQLLRISDKYELLDLKGECEEFLRFNLKIDTAVEVLQMSTLLNAVTLKASAEKFIKRNFQKMKETESIKNLIKTNPEVLVDLLLVV